ncbi:MAG: hypothetical protein GEV03_00390 [Streptosporangiales bacterium]|nr:hypothetical protein [Streptosporangiales bacterium]
MLVAWGNAWLTGHVGLDEAVDAVEHAGGPQVAVGIPGETEEVPLRRGLGALRIAGLTGLRLALPAPGDPLGLPGPASLNTAALEVGEAVLAALPTPVALVPAEDRRGSSYVGVRWTAHEALRAVPDAPMLPEADHALSMTLREATETLLRLDVACWRPELADALATLRELHHREPVGGLAPGYPPRAHRVAALAGRLAIVVELALRDEGGALTATEAARRREALNTLDRAVRRAQVAAYNSALECAR